MRAKAPSLTLPLALLAAACFTAGATPTRAQEPTPDTPSPAQVRRAQNLIKAELARRTSFDAARNLLREKGVPFDPDLLRRPHWRKLLAPTFDQMPEMQTVRWGGAKIKGVLLAHTLYLPEKVEVVGDTVIIVRNLIHEGRNIYMRGGGGSLYVYPIERVGNLGMTLQEAFKRSPVELLNVSLSSPLRKFALPPLVQTGERTFDYSEYEPGATGQEGEPGAPAADAIPLFAGRGRDGVCGSSPHGNGGEIAMQGGAGNKGGTGGAGGAGRMARNLMYDIPSGDRNVWTFLANGGPGGGGGPGGRGSDGGAGATGGSGGNGADCPCSQGGAGSGGDGKDGGAGGRGGEGGDGGPGGKGGEAGQLNITYESDADRPSAIVHSSAGGAGGAGGMSGPPGGPGAGGGGGGGGSGASNTQCPSTTSANGLNGQPAGGLGFGPHGRNGTQGDDGAPRSAEIVARNTLGPTPDLDPTCSDRSCEHWGPWSPVVIDVEGDGFDLTAAAGGVSFDLNGDGRPERLSWTAAGSDDSWLALDRDGNGVIDDGRELFGNFTYQSATRDRNGFLALKEFDYPAWGGAGDNASPGGDGVINRADGVFSMLLLWRDANHNGVSEADELSPLSAAGVEAIFLDYKEARREDEHGNRFRYRAKVRDARGEHVGRWAWDVFLVRQQ